VVIPAYKPGERLVALVRNLREAGCAAVLVVDDGSGEGCSGIFARLAADAGCALVRHAENRGKGSAIKSGLREAAAIWPGCAGFVTADADGQHSAPDVLRICKALEERPDSLILGVRRFSGPGVPAKSRLGNKITKAVFRASTGVPCSDTQTGLRGMPRRLLDMWLGAPGERYEYEMNILLGAAARGVPIAEIPIETLYFDKNSASHFHPWKDSFLIYLRIAKFGASSIISALADLSVFTLLMAAMGGSASKNILAATVVARVASGAANYCINRRWVFASGGGAMRQAAQYILLFCALMFMSWKLVDALYAATGLHTTVIKAFVDCALFLVSYNVQRHFIFRPRRAGFRAHCGSGRQGGRV
jgi:glycosyltransferase involved in cell wall biosynthesis